MSLREKIKAQRERRKRSIRIKIEGSSQRPRLTVYKSLKYVSAQIIDDSKGVTLVSASSQEKDLKSGKNVDIAKEIGKVLATRAKEKNISEVVFDRNGYIYHGKIKSLADGAREAGLKF